MYLSIYLLTCWSTNQLRRVERGGFEQSHEHFRQRLRGSRVGPRLQGLWEQPSRGPRGPGSSHLEPPGALGAAI